jgi:competence protein ComEC
VVGLALAAGAGATLHQLGVPLPWTLLSLVLLLRPAATSSRPNPAIFPLVLGFLAGGILTQQWAAVQARDCRLHLEDGVSLHLVGRLEGRVVEGRGEVRVESGLPPGCNPSLRFVLTGRAKGKTQPGPDGIAAGSPAPGSLVTLFGQWRRGRAGAGDDPIRAGYLRVEELNAEGGAGGVFGDLRGWRGRIQRRLGELFPTQGGLVEALVLARKEGLSPAIRESFASAGTAHLLAISGFHVGVVGGLLLLLGSWLGISHPARFLLGSLGVWGYVLFIGLPDAALRAALILTLLALGRALRRPVAPLGALASAFLAFLLLDPGALFRPGFQLSFAGAFGLTVWAEPMARGLEGVRPFRGRRLLVSGLAAGISATLATLPLVVWYFGRVSLVGIPVTLLVAPFITLAIPGIFLSLLCSTFFPAGGAFLAQGVEVDLLVLTRLVEWTGALPFASIWVSRPALLAGCVGVGGALLYRQLRPSIGWGRGGRPLLLAFGAVAGLLIGPAIEIILHRGTMEVFLLDVGQGDALVIRSPRGRWIVVDAGPKTESFDAGARTVLPFLRRRGAGRVDLLVLTHPDMDHVGGAGAILREFPVGRVLDPGKAVGTDVFLEALLEAESSGVPWQVARGGDSLYVDGIALRVLWPPGEEDLGNNEASVVLELRFGAFSILLTGDAPSEVEEALLPALLSPEFQILKIGHHGSNTSTSPELLERLSPEVALISVGRRNRYGHPHSSVIQRLEASGVEIFRTDEDGTVIIKARRDGLFRIHRLTSG